MSTGTDFQNQPPRRLFLERERAAFKVALEAVRQEFGGEFRLRLAGAEISTNDRVAVSDPSHPEGEPLGFVHNAGADQVAQALRILTAAIPAWSARTPAERAAVLRRGAHLLVERQEFLAAWEVYEAAKSWTEALADVSEAIDYLRFYAAGAETLAQEWKAYRPRGVVAVIPPWNFPAAIPCGMTAAALVTGNPVVLKPAEQTPLAAWHLVHILHEAGVPEDVLLWLPGRGEVAGAALVGSPLVDMVAFTGSAAVGTAIHRAGAGIALSRGGLRATVAEMGGKNPILVFPDADLDEAVVGILASAFGHSNQKCSAASRVLIHRSIYPRLRRRLVEGAASLSRGAADRPGSVLTPLIDRDARERVAAAVERAHQEGKLLLAPPNDRADVLIPFPTLVEIAPQRARSAATTQEEIFGPILALTPFGNDAEALHLANDTRYALTAGVYSRSPVTVARAIRDLDAGNVYVNRPTTGARVGVEPFGGHKLSGTGPKAGSAEYLWAFVTSRRGYRPDTEPTMNGTKAAPAIRPFSALLRERVAIIQRAAALLRGAWCRRWTAAQSLHGRQTTDGDGLEAIDVLLERIDEIARPQSTLQLRGQQTYVRWDRPRGCGLVIGDAGTTIPALLALLAAPLLGGNGILIAAGARLAEVAELAVRALYSAGVPEDVLSLLTERVDIRAAASISAVTFAAADVAEGRAREVARALADASATPESPYLKALITLADGPGPAEAGFLRRFVLPKTVAVRTLHLGAELDLPDPSGV